jgi:hypothetical protein
MSFNGGPHRVTLRKPRLDAWQWFTRSLRVQPDRGNRYPGLP